MQYRIDLRLTIAMASISTDGEKTAAYQVCREKEDNGAEKTDSRKSCRSEGKENGVPRKEEHLASSRGVRDARGSSPTHRCRRREARGDAGGVNGSEPKCYSFAPGGGGWGGGGKISSMYRRALNKPVGKEEKGEVGNIA